MYNVFSNKYLLINIFNYMYDIIQHDNQESIKNDIFTAFNKNSIIFKNSSKLFNILSRKVFCFILNTNKTLNSKHCYVNFTTSEILLNNYIDQYTELKKKEKNIPLKICKFNSCYDIVNTCGSYCSYHLENTFYQRKRYGGHLYSRVCKVCQYTLIYSENKKL